MERDSIHCFSAGMYDVGAKRNIELRAYELPVGQGARVSIELTGNKTFLATYDRVGFPPEMNGKVISDGSRVLAYVVGACEGFLNGTLNIGQKMRLGVDTREAGWLEKFKVDNTQRTKSIRTLG